MLRWLLPLLLQPLLYLLATFVAKACCAFAVNSLNSKRVYLPLLLLLPLPLPCFCCAYFFVSFIFHPHLLLKKKKTKKTFFFCSMLCFSLLNGYNDLRSQHYFILLYMCEFPFPPCNDSEN